MLRFGYPNSNGSLLGANRVPAHRFAQLLVEVLDVPCKHDASYRRGVCDERKTASDFVSEVLSTPYLTVQVSLRSQHVRDCSTVAQPTVNHEADPDADIVRLITRAKLHQGQEQVIIFVFVELPQCGCLRVVEDRDRRFEMPIDQRLHCHRGVELQRVGAHDGCSL